MYVVQNYGILIDGLESEKQILEVD